jgi:hypothetical protein
MSMPDEICGSSPAGRVSVAMQMKPVIASAKSAETGMGPLGRLNSSFGMETFTFMD